MKKCNACGHMNDDAQLFCGQCGNKLGDPDPSAQQPIQATQPPTQNEEPAQTTQPPVDNRTPQQRNYDWYASMKDDSGTKDNGRKTEKKKGKKGVLIGIIVAVVIVVVAFVGILALGGDDESTGTANAPAASEEATMSKVDFIASCQEYTYEEIARDPDQYKGKNAKFTGQVIQVQEDGDDVIMRVSITKNEYDYGDGDSDVFYEDPIYVEYTQKSNSESRVLENDIVTLYGTLGGLMTYESIFGEQISIPSINAEYIEIQGQQ